MRNGDYELVIAPSNYPGERYRGRYCYEHHLVWWQTTREILNSNESMHHRNGNKRDNRFENLEKMTCSEHVILHKSTGRTMVKLACAFCGEEFAREVRNINSVRASGQTDFYCSRSCMGADFGRGRPKYSV